MVARTVLLAICCWAAPTAANNRRWTGYHLGDAELRQRILDPNGGFYGPNLWDQKGMPQRRATSNHQVFLPETRKNGTVAVPSRARDVDCYVRTRWRSFAANPVRYRVER